MAFGKGFYKRVSYKAKLNKKFCADSIQVNDTFKKKKKKKKRAERGLRRIVLARKISTLLQWSEDLDQGQMEPQPRSREPPAALFFSLFEIARAALLAFLLGLSAAGRIHLPCRYAGSIAGDSGSWRSHTQPQTQRPGRPEARGTRKPEALLRGYSPAGRSVSVQWRVSARRGRPCLFNRPNASLEN